MFQGLQPVENYAPTWTHLLSSCIAQFFRNVEFWCCLGASSVLFGSLLLFPKQRSHERLRQPDGEHLGSWSPSAQISQGFYPMDFLVKDMEATSSLVSSPRILLGIPMDSIWFHLPAVNAVNAAGPASDSGEPSAALGSLVQCSKPLVDYARSDGEIGHGTSLRNMMFSTKKIITVKPLKIYIYIYHIILYPDYHKKRISEQGVV